MEKIKNFVTYILVPLITVFTGSLVVFVDREISRMDISLKEQVSQIEAKAKERDLAIKQQLADLDQVMRESKDQREERESNQKFNLKIYDIVTDSLEKKDEKKQAAAKAFIVVMVEEPLRTSLLSVLEQGAESRIKKEVSRILSEEMRFKEEISATLVNKDKIQPSYTWADWDFDIFWCASSGIVAESQATLIAERLIAEEAKGRIRVRKLPESKNAQNGYRAFGYEIRRNSNEINVADALGQLSNGVLDNNKIKFTYRTTTQKTPWYISTFICPSS